MARLNQLNAGMVVWARNALKKGEFCKRHIYAFTNKMGGEKRVLLSKYAHEDSYSPAELVIDELEARKIQIAALQKEETEIRLKKEEAMMGAVDAVHRASVNMNQRQTERVEAMEKRLSQLEAPEEKQEKISVVN